MTSLSRLTMSVNPVKIQPIRPSHSVKCKHKHFTNLKWKRHLIYISAKLLPVFMKPIILISNGGGLKKRGGG